MYISVFFSHVRELAAKEGITLDAALERVKAMGIVGAECSSNELLSDPSIPTRLDKHGLRLTAVHGGADLTKGDTAPARSLLELTAKVGADCLLIIPGRADSPEQKKDAFSNIAGGLSELCGYGKELGVKVTVENFSSSLAPYSTADDLIALFQAVPELLWTLDSGNFRCVCEAPLNTSAVLISKAVNVHLKDWSLTLRREGDGSFTSSDGSEIFCSSLGEGIIPNSEILRLLTAVGYGGPLTVELHGPSDPLSDIEESCGFILKHLPKA